jgi:hypothetical protein
MKIRFSKTDWVRIGNKSGWLKGAMAINVPGETEKSLARYNDEHVREALKDFNVIQSYQAKINNALRRCQTIVGSAGTAEEMVKLVKDIVPVLEGIRMLYVHFYQGLKSLREKASLVELNPIIQSLYNTIEEVYRAEENYKTWTDITVTNTSEENRAKFLDGSKNLPEVIKHRNDVILSEVSVAEEQFSKIIPKEEPKPTPTPTIPTPEVSKPTEVTSPEIPKVEVPNPVVGQTYKNTSSGSTFSIKNVDLEKQEVIITSGGKDFDPIPLKKITDAIREGKLVATE